MFFEVIKTPEGNSPPWVRNAWIGLQFRALQQDPVTLPSRDAQTGQTHEKRGYPANARELLGLLALHREDAARWYIENAPQMLDESQVFVLDEACCIPISKLMPRAPIRGC